MNKIQRIIDELDKGPKTVDQFNIGISGVYLRSMLSTLVQLGMVFEHQTWPRTYSLTKTKPDEFRPTVETEPVKQSFDAMMEADMEMLDSARVGQHIVHDIRTGSIDDLLALKHFMGFATAKIDELLDNLEPVSIDDIKIRK